MVPGHGTFIPLHRLAAYLPRRPEAERRVLESPCAKDRDPGCTQRQEAGAACDPGSLSFDKHLAKVNREDRIDLSAAARAAHARESTPGAQPALAPRAIAGKAAMAAPKLGIVRETMAVSTPTVGRRLDVIA
ncbi:MAG: hypothetical protein H7Y88_02330 [Phycisphaerales bacterium]|nr:hypothetical protein [Phycisphaerales bacterium]